MKLDPILKAAIDSVDLKTAQGRSGATALAIVLLDKIYSAEADELDWMDIFLHGLDDEAVDKECESYYNNIATLSAAVSSLYNTFGLRFFRRLGISYYIRYQPDLFFSG